jgi:hypothetical protein
MLGRMNMNNAVEGFPPDTNATVSLGAEPTVRRLGFGAVRFFPSMFRTDSPFTIPWEDAAIP